MIKKKKNNFEKMVDYYMLKFLRKQYVIEGDDDIPEYSMIGYDIVEFSDIYISIGDLVYDVEQKLHRGLYIEYYDYDVDSMMKGYSGINYSTYVKGFRHKNRTKIAEFKYRVKESVKSIWFKIRFYYEYNFTKDGRDRAKRMKEVILGVYKNEKYY